jgi:hypothetical protein
MSFNPWQDRTWCVNQKWKTIGSGLPQSHLFFKIIFSSFGVESRNDFELANKKAGRGGGGEK